MFTDSPRFSRLPQQVARALEGEIARGTLRDSLPGERQLAEKLQVSRRTIRSALDVLRRRRLIGTEGGRTRILASPIREAHDAEPRPQIASAGLLLPESIDRLRPQTALFIDALRARLYAHGIPLETHVGQRFFSSRPGAALERLAARFPGGGWILAFSTRENQAWFQARRLPVVVAGTPHEGIVLPYVDIDLRAAGRHVAARLGRLGHRRIALLLPQPERAGDRHTEEGFRDGAAGFGPGRMAASVLRHSGTAEGVRRVVLRMLRGALRPTALVVANPLHYLTAASVLAGEGVSIPAEMSLVCRDDDVFLASLHPEPARYRHSPATRAKVAFSLLMRAAGGEPTERLGARLLPSFVAGASLTAPPAGIQTGPAPFL